MIYSSTLKKHYQDWLSLEKAIEALPTAKARGNVFEEFTFAYFTIKAQMYQVAEIYTSADIPDKYRKSLKLGNKQHQDSGVDGLIITKEGKSIAYQCKFRSGRVKPTYEELTKFWSDGRYCDFCCTVANSYSVSNLSDKHKENLQVLAKDFDTLDKTFFDLLFDLVNNENIKKNKVFHTPYTYQEHIINEVIEGFSVEDRGKIIAACGTGKTLTSLWIVETMKVETVLFLAPSISLVKQTLESWADQAKVPFTYLCVCSDNTVSSNINDDEADISVSQLGVPVTTDINEIANFLDNTKGKVRYIFSTYQSADKISEAQKIAKDTFDLIICDEAHRTAGLRSNFSLALEDQFIRSKKRLFMTATERMVRPLLKRNAEESGKVIFSMDDENAYGPLLSKYNFGKAILDKTISDYKIIVAGVKESEVYNYIAENKHLRVEDLDENSKIQSAETLYSKILLAKAMREFSIKKTISFHSSIQRAKNFVSENGEEISLSSVIRELNQNIESSNLYIDNINCQIDAGSRAQILDNFRNSEFSVISNAKCLTEGVDVPIIDSVYFIDRKKSLVDIVQACGRALRTKKGVAKTAYFIIPILIPESSVASDILHSEDFEIVYNIIQALRDQDNRLEDWINRLNSEYIATGRIGRSPTENDPVSIQIEGVDIQQFSEELYVQIATVNANPTDAQKKQVFGKGERKTGHSRIFKTIGDFSFETFIKNLIDPTINIFRDKKRNIMSGTDLKYNHNNVSHTFRLGLTEKDGKNYKLTPLGEYYLDGEIKPRDLFKKQMLRYSNTLEDQRSQRILFPYRACLEILKGLESFEPLTFNEFAFCIYPMYDSTEESIQTAIEDIKYLRKNYPKLEAISMANQPQILEVLNNHFTTSLTETDIWGAKTTTVKNQFIYFRNHLSLFDEIIVIKNGNICLKTDISAKDIEKILSVDRGIEKIDKKNWFAKYTEVFIMLIIFGLV
ncbi:DEAD/DEAH box helicase family protein [Bacteroides faecichinchillae]|uniref:DEAD/DEAH box helicase family protein n=1 Tax=Bacteroides faecichinchillae TaxID=871325 RepID=UPI003515E86A